MHRHRKDTRTGTIMQVTTSNAEHHGGIANDAAAKESNGHGDQVAVHALAKRRRDTRVKRGLSASIATTELQRRIWLRALSMLARFRVMRTVDVAVTCFPERGFKAALTAAQRAVRGMVKAELIRRYKTDRFQTVYGLSARGATWLDEHGVDAEASIRRVSDMSNPEHRLWAQFLVLCCEARGLKSQTESELLASLNVGRSPEQALVQGLLDVDSSRAEAKGRASLRPDLVGFERTGGCVWFEVDRSKRSAEREGSLRELIVSMGEPLRNGSRLSRVVLFARTERIEQRALAVVGKLIESHAAQVLTEGRRQVRPTPTQGLFEVWAGVLQRLPDQRQAVVSKLVGHVCVQRLPTWLPKFRMDESGRHSSAGWFGENFLPFIHESGWNVTRSPLVT